jgi:hypothetical protein
MAGNACGSMGVKSIVIKNIKCRVLTVMKRDVER